MFGVCLRYAKNQMEAEDFLQEGFIRVFKNIKQYNGSGSLEGWIRRVVINVCLEIIRKEKTMLFINREEYQTDYTDNPITEYYDTEYLLKAIQSLSEGYRTVFNLYAIEGYSHKEIAGLLEISEGTSKSQLARARQLLQSKLTMHSSIKMNFHVQS